MRPKTKIKQKINGEKMLNKIKSIQDWIPIEEIYCNGIIKTKNKKFIKIIKIIPINYDLKSDFEKKVILNSYKIFLKNCNFETQIIIQSNKEDISKNIKKIENQKKIEKNKNNIFDKYIFYIKEKNKEAFSASKNFFIIIKSKKNQDSLEEDINKELKEGFFKIKETLARCGNLVYEIKEKKELEEIIKSFFLIKKE